MFPLLFTPILLVMICVEPSEPRLTVDNRYAAEAEDTPCPSTASDQQASAQKQERPKPVDLRELLEQGMASKSLPEGLVIRIGMCIGEPDDSVPQDAQEIVEMWEFTPGFVHRVECKSQAGNPVYHRIESRWIDDDAICQGLLDGRALEISERKGTGPKTVLAGTPYQRGSRSIEVELGGNIILDLHETNGPAFDAYSETDAIAFGRLYQQLAVQARDVLGPDAGEISRLTWQGSGMVDEFGLRLVPMRLSEELPTGLKGLPKAQAVPRYGVLEFGPEGKVAPVYVLLDAAKGEPGTLYVTRRTGGEMMNEAGHPMTLRTEMNMDGDGEEISRHATEVSLEIPFIEGIRSANVIFMRAAPEKEYYEELIGYALNCGYVGSTTINGKSIPTVVQIMERVSAVVWFDFNGSGKIDAGEKVDVMEPFLFEGQWWSVSSIGSDGTIRLDAPLPDTERKETITADQARMLEARLAAHPDALDYRYALRQLFMHYRDEANDKQKAMATLEREYDYVIAKANSKEIKRMLRTQFYACVGAEADGQVLVALEREHDFLIQERNRDYGALIQNLHDWIYRLTLANEVAGIAKARELLVESRKDLADASDQEAVSKFFATCEGFCNRPTIGDTLDITFTALDETKVDLATMKDKVVLVDFWATKCAPYIASQPGIKAAYEKYHDKGFEVIGISLDDVEGKDKVVQFLKEKELPWPQLFDGKGWETPLAVGCGISAIPATFLIGKDGKIVAIDVHGEELESKLAELLK